MKKLDDLGVDRSKLCETLESNSLLTFGNVEMKIKLLEESNELIISGRDISTYLELIEHQVQLNRI